jgi:Leucine-rich repeat (LRR) protein
MYTHTLKSGGKVIVISRSNIGGILDLKNNTRLEILDCSGNNITAIINIPFGLEELDCSHNQIIQLENLPNSLIKLNCSYNNIMHLDNLPYNLIVLICRKNKLSYLNMIPEGLEILECDYNCIEKLEDLPHSLKKLNCSSNLITYINYLPDGLEELNCSKNNIWKISKLPNQLKELDCSNNKIEGVFTFISTKLSNAYIQNNKIESLENLANCAKLKILNCENNQITHIDGIPDNLEEFIANNNLFKWLWVISKKLEVIGIEKHKLDPDIKFHKTLIILDNK